MNTSKKILSLLVFGSSLYGSSLTSIDSIPPQYSNRTCQSYALSLALFQSDKDGDYNLLDKNNKLSFEKIRSLELRIREEVKKQMRSGRSTRTDWNNAIKNFTFSRYGLKDTYLTEIKFFNYLKKHFKQNEKMKCEKNDFLCMLNNIKKRESKILLTSLSSLNKDNDYTNTGHVIGIIDYKKENGVNKIKIINSSEKYGTKSCYEESGIVSWVSEFELKSMHYARGKNYYNLSWIVKNNLFLTPID